MALPSQSVHGLTRLQLGLQYVKAKISEQILRSLKTDQACVILFGNDKTKHGFMDSQGYENVNEIITPVTADTHILDALDKLAPSRDKEGDILSALLVTTAIIMKQLGNKHSWRREIILVTDGQSTTDWTDVESLRQQMENNNIDLVVAGIDFNDDQMGFIEQNKSESKAETEAVLNLLVDRLGEHAVLGNAKRAFEAVLTPNPKIPSSAALNLPLRLGDTENDPTHSLTIEVVVKKATAKAPLMSLKKLIKKRHYANLHNKDADINVVDDEDEDEDEDSKDRSKEDPSIPERRTVYFHQPKHEQPESLADLEKKDSFKTSKKSATSDSSQHHHEKKFDLTKIKPLERDRLVKAYLFGSTRVSVDDIDPETFGLTGTPGFDILEFIPHDCLPTEYKLGEVDYVYGSPKHPSSQVAFSALIWALSEGKKMALARIVRNKKSYAPRIGVLYPSALWNGTNGGDNNIDLCYWVEVPFMEDVRKYRFPSLERLFSAKTGQRVYEHKNLPTNEMQDVMDKFVDSMDLMHAGDEDDEGRPEPWMNDLHDRYNPAIHNLKNAILFRMSNDEDCELPEPHAAVTQFFDPPDSVLRASKEPLEKLAKKFDVKKVPKKVSYKNKSINDDELEIIDLVDILGDDNDDKEGAEEEEVNTKEDGGETTTAMNSTSYRYKQREKDEQSARNKEKEWEKEKIKENLRKKRIETADESTTEEEDEEEEEDNDQMQVDSLIGEKDPIGDFQRLVNSGGDVYSEIMQGMSKVIPRLVKTSFSVSNFGKALECMKLTRNMAAEMDEANTWNEFMRSFKSQLQSFKHGKDFWECVRDDGLGLLTREEVVASGIENTDVTVTHDKAQEFVASLT